MQNNQLLLDAIKNFNSKIKVFSIATYGFSLCTKIPHNKLDKVMRRLIIFCLKGDKKKFIAVTKFGTTGTNNRNKFNIYIKFNFLRENRLFNFGN